MNETGINNIKAQMRKGMLEYCILLLLSERRAYPSDIIGSLSDADMIEIGRASCRERVCQYV